MKRRTGRLFATKHYLKKNQVRVISGEEISWNDSFWARKTNIFQATEDFEICSDFKSKILKGQKFRLKTVGDECNASEFELV